MYYSESMIQMVEDLHHQASAMEKEVKHMMELEGRALGIELDKRKSARDLYNELMRESALTYSPVASVCRRHMRKSITKTPLTDRLVPA